MATKKRAPDPRSSDELSRRVYALELDVQTLRAGMVNLVAELNSLKHSVKAVDERTLRGEKLMLEMQGEQHRMAKTIDRIATVLRVAPDESEKP